MRPNIVSLKNFKVEVNLRQEDVLRPTLCNLVLKSFRGKMLFALMAQKSVVSNRSQCINKYFFGKFGKRCRLRKLTSTTPVFVGGKVAVCFDFRLAFKTMFLLKSSFGAIAIILIY